MKVADAASESNRAARGSGESAFTRGIRSTACGHFTDEFGIDPAGMRSRAMATFLILPPRELIEHAVKEFAGRLLPGVWPPEDIADVFVNRILESQPKASDVYLLHREDLPDSDVIVALQDAFGAEPGDRVVEFGPPRTLAPAPLRSTVIPAAVSPEELIWA
jgi:hypothetical protein